MSYTITANKQFNSNEIYFTHKPKTEVLTTLNAYKIEINNL